MAFLSQAPPLGGLLPPHGAFQEHAAHPPRWPGELSSKGSSDTCISDGVFHIPMPCFHGARSDQGKEGVSGGERPGELRQIGCSKQEREGALWQRTGIAWSRTPLTSPSAHAARSACRSRST